MLNKIEIKNVFAHKHTTITFEAGLTRLHGANEAGKSQVFEMVRWALFGSKALRTSAEDYKGGSVTLTFNGDYVVNRTTGNATLHRGTELIARSTTAVNRKIIEIIGYGLKTFDNVNSIQQDEVQKLTKMKSEDRKKFLDELIGAAQIDSLIADYKAELQVLTSEVNATQNQIVDIMPPAGINVPELEVIEAALDQLTARRADIRVQERVVESLRADVSKLVVVPDAMPNETIESLEKQVEEARQLDAASKKARIEYPQIARLYDMGARSLDVAELSADVAAVVASRAIKEPQWSLEEIALLEQKHKANDAHIEVQRLRQELETYQVCPGLDDLRQETADKINALIPAARPHGGLPSKEALVEAKEAHRDYGAAQEALEGITSPYAKAFSDHVDFYQDVFDRVVAILDTAVPDILAIYASINAKKVAATRTEKERELQEAEKLLDPVAIQEIDSNMESLRQSRAIRQRYDADLRHYQETMTKNEALIKKVEEKKAEQTETAKVVKALQGFKYYINTYFLPSVSKAATAMLITMTNGKWKKITITDKFEIAVDGKQVEALSGSTRAIVNIALRFALQFVLTKNSFSVFMADEVDGAMDANRANYLNECLGNMVEHIKQVIVISHKDITAPNNIKL